MRGLWLLVAGVGVLAVAVGGILFFPRQLSAPSERSTMLPQAPMENAMKLTSPAFQDNGTISAKYTCDGDDVSPPLMITGVPQAAQSLVLIVDDPDAPRGDWVHWTVWNIAPTTTGIAENRAPDGSVEGMTDFGKSGYGGPCPPSGTHRYHFTLTALDSPISLGASATKADLERAMGDHTLAQATLIGRYSRE